NPIAAINAGGYSKSTAPEYSARVSATIKPFKGMTILGQYNWKRNDGRTKVFADTYEEFEGGAYKGTFPTAEKSASEERSTKTLKQFNVTATYENTFAEKHYLKAMIGFQSEEFQTNSLTAKRSGYYYNGYEDIVHGDAATATNNSYSAEYALLGYLFRLNYIFADRYLLEITGRYDGTSRFLKEQRWGYYPAISAGWRLSEESFWEPIRHVVDNFKIRASYGKLGNQDLSEAYFPYVSPIVAGLGYGYWFDKTYTTGVAQTTLGNPLIHWEKSIQRNIGLDISLFNSRLSGTFDFYYRHIEDMLQIFTLPEFVGIGAPYQNAGSMRNVGWEISLGWNDKVGNVSYYIKGNLYDNRNKILKLYGNERRSGNTLLAEGVSYNNYFGFVADGYFQSYDEIYAKDADGNYINAVYNERDNTKPGYIKYKDLNGDGVINLQDREVIGDGRPHFEFSLQLGAEWKGIDFSAMLQGVGQKDVYYTGGGSRPLLGNATLYAHQLDTWTPENPNAKYPLLLQDPNGNSQNNMFSTFWLKSAAYCRLKNITIGYTLPKMWTKAAYIERVRFYASAQNLLTLRGSDFYKGFDPETSAGASCYPLNKTFLFGVNLEF
ncbi:MAG: SusC/RagA family TonB-linked outer membrane protein, partial [Muribaculaceae bacterium]|nr:SusC/RagA family TonB-linked outer membrane protein [Muribaculaceae bacterium]